MSGSTSCGPARKINHHKWAAKENNGCELVPAGVGVGEALGRTLNRINIAKGWGPGQRNKVLCKESWNLQAWGVFHSWSTDHVPISPITSPGRGRKSLSSASGEQVTKRQQLCSPQEQRECQTSAGKLLFVTELLFLGDRGFPPAAHLMEQGKHSLVTESGPLTQSLVSHTT